MEDPSTNQSRNTLARGGISAAFGRVSFAI
jgi:hypothetical protein